MIFEIIKIIAIILSISGAILVASKLQKLRLIGFIIWIFANTIWLVNSLTYKDYVQSILWLTYLIICIKGIYSNN